MRLAVNPTRMEMLRLRNRLSVAQRGHKLLKDKLDGLMKDFGEYAQKYKECRLAVDAELPVVLKLFVLAEATSSRLIVEDALELTRQELDITSIPTRIMSVVIPRLEFSFGKSLGGYSLIHTSAELDKAISGLKVFMEKLLTMAELEETVRRLAQEIEKTRRRVNALEHTVIPRLLETIKFIKNKLDEMERSTTSRLMKIKEQRLAQEGK
ncbi:MAG TPA: V-type ATP synthase subunit D [Candidatus Hydrogenedentes bacterium]|jgi:V/A-type H+-transporting ATPase subunit D|nr:MAG: V-type sodium ATPase subunit D [Candidatus Hydrogenedentes bacterium ADurb.Bin170]HNZ48520.1 V-type ATP synthase subunit D [Candidatus Hydrogenedentota bacterium]HOD95556.1 V-type ATP synthase subunit D [Candidatus Hydrogenedentota bacterium]HOH41708.1 V-type ATP synthase subunit D [Candidatus Hydrogenedentota bacterium]HOM47399.1 V-type ATP synthase subunit D [Candidatus Hydrogenedentota bacterium]